MVQLILFRLDGQRFALEVGAVERVLPAAEITPLPKAPEIVLGVINLHGTVLPVVDVRRRFRLPAREMRLADRLLVARTARRPLVLLVDEVLGVEEVQQEGLISGESVLPGLGYVRGIVRRADGLILIHDLETFLSLEESDALDAAVPPA